MMVLNHTLKGLQEVSSEIKKLFYRLPIIDGFGFFRLHPFRFMYRAPTMTAKHFI